VVLSYYQLDLDIYALLVASGPLLQVLARQLRRLQNLLLSVERGRRDTPPQAAAAASTAIRAQNSIIQPLPCLFWDGSKHFNRTVKKSNSVLNVFAAVLRYRQALCRIVRRAVVVAGGKAWESEEELEKLRSAWLGEENGKEVDDSQAFYFVSSAHSKL